MLTLGDLLGQARASASLFEQWLDGADPTLADRVRSAAEARGESPGRFARGAVADFDRHAGGEAWTRLTGRLHGVADPGLACLEEMVRWRLATPQVETMEEAR
jgi:hypothetical protein